MCFELYPKYTEKVKRSQLGHLNHIPISLLITELIQSLAPDKSGRFTGFWYANGKMINQLNTCHLEHDKVYHIPPELVLTKKETITISIHMGGIQIKEKE